MERELFQKIIGIIILIALVGSMFAAALIYAPQPPAQNNQPLVPQNQTIYEYNINFQTSVIQELDFIRIAVETSELNKNDIDLEIQSIPGVSRIQSSQFISNNTDKWVYFAEINLRKKINVIDVVNEIFELKFFNGDKQAMKRVSIITPKEAIELYNSDLNITRNFTFDYTETFAIASLDTRVGDEITLSGTISLSGTTITYIELIESQNLSASPEYYPVTSEFEIITIDEGFFFEGTNDSNIDQNYYETELKKLDENAIVFVYDSTIYGQTKAIKSEVENILIDLNDLKFTQNATIFIETLFIEDLNQEIAFNTEEQIEIDYGRSVGEKILAEIMVSISRTTNEIVQVIQK